MLVEYLISELLKLLWKSNPPPFNVFVTPFQSSFFPTVVALHDEDILFLVCPPAGVERNSISINRAAQLLGHSQNGLPWYFQPFPANFVDGPGTGCVRPFRKSISPVSCYHSYLKNLYGLSLYTTKNLAFCSTCVSC